MEQGDLQEGVPAVLDTARFGTWFLPYGSTIVGTCGAIVLRYALTPWLGDRALFLTVWPIVVIASLFGGVGPGFFSLVLALVALPGVLVVPLKIYFGDMLAFALSSVPVVILAAMQTSWRRQALASAEEARRHAREARNVARELTLLIDSAEKYTIFFLNAAGQVAQWNHGAERLTGWAAADVRQRSHAMFYPAADREAGRPAEDLARAKAEGRVEQKRIFLRSDGTSMLAKVIVTAVYDNDGTLLGFGVVLRDIMAEHVNEAAKEAREAQLSTILATVPHAMAIIDEDEKLISFNAAAEEMFGYREADILGENVAVLMPEPDRQRHHIYVQNYFATGIRRVMGRNRRLTAQARDGTTFPIELYVGEAKAAGRRFFVGLMRDLRPSDEAQARLQELQTELFHASRLSAMGTMGTAIAHEVNQPLAAIVNWVETSRAQLDRLQSRCPDVATPLQALDAAAGEAMRVGAIVSSLREFVAFGNSGKVEADLTDIVVEATTLGLLGARSQNVRIRFDPEEAGICPVIVNRVQIQQVLLNLFRNGVDAMSPGGGELQVQVRCHDDVAHVCVADNGPGVPPALRDRLFQSFLSTKANGVGVGLSICRTIVEAHGGRIWVEDRPEGGACFQFTLDRRNWPLGERGR